MNTEQKSENIFIACDCLLSFLWIRITLTFFHSEFTNGFTTYFSMRVLIIWAWALLRFKPGILAMSALLISVLENFLLEQ